MNAIVVDQTARKLDRGLCNLCLKCADVCPTGALAVTGQWMTVDDVMQEVASDDLFYQNSVEASPSPAANRSSSGNSRSTCSRPARNGASIRPSRHRVTLSGASLEKVLEYTDLVLYDVKHMDSAKHREGTGKTNELILENARKAAAKRRLWVRVPLIPGYDDAEENLKATARFAKEIGAAKVSTSPLPRLGQKSKFEKLGRRFTMEDVPTPTSENVERCRKIVQDAGLMTAVGR